MSACSILVFFFRLRGLSFSYCFPIRTALSSSCFPIGVPHHADASLLSHSRGQPLSQLHPPRKGTDRRAAIPPPTAHRRQPLPRNRSRRSPPSGAPSTRRSR